MLKFVSRLENVDTRLLMVACVLLSAVVFAGVKAVGAFGEKEQPAYRNHPAKAFVPPASETLVESRYLGQQRLPDADYEQLVTAGKPVAGQLGRLQASKSSLTAAGMTPSAAERVVSNLDLYRSQLRSRDVTVAEDVTVQPGNATSSAQVTSEVQYSASSDGAPPIAGVVALSFSRRGERWQLTTATLTLDDTTLLTP